MAEELIDGPAVQAGDHGFVHAVGEVLAAQQLVESLGREGWAPLSCLPILRPDLEARVPVGRGALNEDSDVALEGGPSAVRVRNEAVLLARCLRRLGHESHSGERVSVEEVHAPQRAAEGTLFGLRAVAVLVALAQAAPVDEDAGFLREVLHARRLEAVAQLSERGALGVWMIRPFPRVRDHEEGGLALRRGGQAPQFVDVEEGLRRLALDILAARERPLGLGLLHDPREAEQADLAYALVRASERVPQRLQALGRKCRCGEGGSRRGELGLRLGRMARAVRARRGEELDMVDGRVLHAAWAAAGTSQPHGNEKR